MYPLWKLGFLFMPLLWPLSPVAEASPAPYTNQPSSSAVQTLTSKISPCKPAGTELSTTDSLFSESSLLSNDHSVVVGVPVKTPDESSVNAPDSTVGVPSDSSATFSTAISTKIPATTPVPPSLSSAILTETTVGPLSSATTTIEGHSNPAETSTVTPVGSSTGLSETIESSVANSQDPETMVSGTSNPTGTFADSLEPTGTGIQTGSLADTRTGSTDATRTGTSSDALANEDTATRSRTDFSSRTRNTVGASHGASEAPGESDRASLSGVPTETSINTRLPTGTPHGTESQSVTPRATSDIPTDDLTGSEKPTQTSRATGALIDSSAGTGISTGTPAETDATRSTGTDVTENTPGTSSVTEIPVEVSSTATNSLETSAAGGEHSGTTQFSGQPTETGGLETIITGTDDAVVTYAPTKDPDYTSVTRVTTTTDDDNNVIVIWPGGWIWVPKGSLPTVFPGPPNTNPDPNSGSGGGSPGEDPDDPDDEPSPSSTREPTSTEEPTSTTSSECTATEPPECTKTASYTWLGTEYSKTIIGTCLPTSACMTGQQSTTTEVISPTMVVDERFNWQDNSYVPTNDDAGADPDEETVEWFRDFFEENDLPLAEDDEVTIAPECRGDRSGLDYTCFTSLFPTFCLQVDNDEDKELAVNLTNDGGSTSKRRFVSTRRLLPRAAQCGGSTISFEWTGANDETECTEDCSGSMDQLAASCALSGDQGIYQEGSVDVGCGTYKYKVEKGVAETTTTTSATTSATSTGNPTSSEPAATERPLKISDGFCNNQTDLRATPSFWSQFITPTAEEWCAEHNNTAIGASDSPIKHIVGNPESPSFWLSVSWDDGCVTTDESQSVYRPIREGRLFTCPRLLNATFHWCAEKKDSNAGYIYAGCLKYLVDWSGNATSP